MTMEKSHNKDFLSRLRDLMGEFHLKSPADLAKFADVGWSTANQWLNGSIPRKHALDALASRLRVTSTWLLTGEGDKTPVNLDDVQRLHGIVSESPMTYNQSSDRWREAYLELAKITPQNTVYGLEILIRVDPPDSKAAIQGLAALAKKNQDQSD